MMDSYDHIILNSSVDITLDFRERNKVFLLVLVGTHDRMYIAIVRRGD
jgi:hypothetical protein